MTKVFVNGTFDILHPGHIALLEFARAQGNWLRVAIDSDRRVRELKGADRPVMDQDSRVAMLSALRAVDEVVVFDTDWELLKHMMGHAIMVKGSDYQDQLIVGSGTGIEIVFFPRIKQFSTTGIIEKIHARS
jgi:D-beta-D-heptose 7-phosphate kinase/D-beta-D-heptose 1-phosphate adenosyltransferase